MGGFVAKVIAPKPKPKPVYVAPPVQKEAVQAAPKGPTAAELVQSKKVGVNRRGRRATMLTSYKGVDEDVTLGTKTLLG